MRGNNPLIHRRRELGLSARLAGSARRVSRHPDEWGAAVSGSRRAGPALVVPGWYGCAWIKWVNDVRLTAPDEPATSQMKEFAGRTHQAGRPDLAKDYTPAGIQTAATPDPRRKATRPGRHRVPHRGHRVGTATGRSIDWPFGFRADDAWTPFSICPAPKTHRMWSLWEYRWKPAAAGSLRDRAQCSRPLSPPAAARDRLLHAAGQSRGDLNH